MTKVMNRVLQDIQTLSYDEKNDLMKFLIVSLDESHDTNSDEQWADISKKRYDDIKNGSVKALDWEEIKSKVLN